MTAKKVFISYSHDSPEHAARVAGLAASLRRDGVDCRIDQYVEGSPPEGWPLWMEKTLEWAEIVLVVCTETYHRRVRKEEKPGKGHGATWEAHLIYQQLYEAHLFNAKFVPVIFNCADKDFIPASLRGVDCYLLDDQKGYDDLYVTITGQHKPPPDLGQVKVALRELAYPMFGEPGLEASGLAAATLKKPARQKPPTRPYPFLRPYEHSGTFGGRESEISELMGHFQQPMPIIGLYGTSGVGKSSVLRAGVTWELRIEGKPVASVSHPNEPGLGHALATQMLDGVPKTFGDQDWNAFVDCLRLARELSGKGAVLILDQFDQVLRSEDPSARARVGVLLAATIRERSTDEPLCHWVLSYRSELHGPLCAWLSDVLKEARQQDWPGIEALPYDLSDADRFQYQVLHPLGRAERGTQSVEESEAAFRRAITKPLDLRTKAGEPLFSIGFVGNGLDRLAQAFAEIRRDQPGAPLVPELQVVLNDLLKGAGWPSSGPVEVLVPEKPRALVERALEKQLKRALYQLFPEGTPTAQEQRARTLLALHTLTASQGDQVQRNEGRSEASLIRSLGEDGTRLLDRLTREQRLVYPTGRGEKVVYLLSHDRLAQVIADEANKDPSIRDWLDRRIVALHRIVDHKSRLFFEEEISEATRLETDLFKRIKERKEVLLFDDRRRKWWTACEKRRLKEAEEHRKRLAYWAVGTAVLVAALSVLGWYAYRQIQIQNLTAQLESDPGDGKALSFLATLNGEYRVSPESLAETLEKRVRPRELFEYGPYLLPGDSVPRDTVWQAVKGAQSFLVEQFRKDLHSEQSISRQAVMASALYALDKFGLNDPLAMAQATRVRADLVEALTKAAGGPPKIAAEWSLIKGGTFTMGMAGDFRAKFPEVNFKDDEAPHEVSVSDFTLLRHEVTNQQFGELFPEWDKAARERPNQPAFGMNWYEAYVFAAWLGQEKSGRLPSEAEWEYAARSRGKDQLFPWGNTLPEKEEVCDYAAVRGCGVSPKCSAKKGQTEQGLCDMAGNLWEWVADWYGPYSMEEQKDQLGAPPPNDGGYRVVRGGSFDYPPVWARTSRRSWDNPSVRDLNLGFRVVLPAPQPSK